MPGDKMCMPAVIPMKTTFVRLISQSCWVERLYRVYKKKLNKPEIALRLCKAPQCTKFFIEIGCLGTNNVVYTEKLRNLKF